MMNNEKRHVELARTMGITIIILVTQDEPQ